jgi:hypothetical protein
MRNPIPAPLVRRRGSFEFTDQWRKYVRRLPETGMDYIVVGVALGDGRTYDRVLISDTGYVDRVHGLPDISFTEADIIKIVATHRRWIWKETP